jgi:UDP-2-acetamido-2,6-beta-L-arabino-hexul-4-ose reductase
MKVVVTGAEGFIGRNLVVQLREFHYEVCPIIRGDTEADLSCALGSADAVVHLAGENRPQDPSAFERVNAGFTRRLCEILSGHGNSCPVVLASSTQADLDNPYGRSKLAAESAVAALSSSNGNPVAVFRLPGVFGKWCRPNYNSVVATFCHNIANDLPVQISDASRTVRLVYVDDVIEAFVAALRPASAEAVTAAVEPEYSITLGDLAAQIQAFGACRNTLMTERVGVGFLRALYATYVSYLPTEKFKYGIPVHGDARGVFVEMLKTPDTGQFSFFTAHPGVTRGAHYHHTKTEKFLVIRGRARFGFRHLLTQDVHFLETSGDCPEIVETIPGWAHDITNVGENELVVMLWASEVFDRSRPDTIAGKVK